MKRGQIVLSKAGRDFGSYLIVSHLDENGVYVVDGKKRPVDRPKRKNPKHLSVTGCLLSEADFATNRSARKSLRVAISDEILKGEK